MPRLYFRDPADGVLKPLAGGLIGNNEVTIQSATPTDAGVELWVKQDENSTAVLDARYINSLGDEMRGPLLLHSDPVDPLEAATKGYIDARIWFGTLAQYNAITTKDATVLYVIQG